MQTIYFKTNEGLLKEVANQEHSGYITTPMTLKCNCGESFGYCIDNENTFETVRKLVLCESCFESVSKQEQGE